VRARECFSSLNLEQKALGKEVDGNLIAGVLAQSLGT
jgi:hypothetical protein